MGCRGYFVVSAVHSKNLDVLVAMVRLLAQRWQMLSGKGRAAGFGGTSPVIAPRC